MSLLELTHRTIQQHNIIPAGSTLIVGVSGGADSLALLHVLHHLRARLSISLHAATFDHGMRGEDSASDVRYVVELCRTWGIPASTGRASIPLHSEDMARTARYDFLASVATASGTPYIAVAHHADDQAETVFMRLIRGAGLQGLSGMRYSAPLPGHPELTLIRPLLNATRQQIIDYCDAHRLSPRHDASNQDTSLLRNRIRQDLLPRLRQLNPQIDRALVQLADSASQDYDFIQQALQQQTGTGLTVTTDRVQLEKATFRNLHPALQRHFVLYAVQTLGGKDVGYEHVLKAVRLANSGDVGQLLPLPGDLQLRVDYTSIAIEQPDAPPDYVGPLLPQGTVLDVPVPGEVTLPGGRWVLQAGEVTRATEQARLLIRDGQRVTLRTRRPGDRFGPAGLDGHTQTIKKWMVDHKVPQRIRNQIPLVVVDGEIAAFYISPRWVTGEKFAVNKPDSAAKTLLFRQTSTS